MSTPAPSRPRLDDPALLEQEQLRARLASAMMVAFSLEPASRIASELDVDLGRRLREAHGAALETMGRLRAQYKALLRQGRK